MTSGRIAAEAIVQVKSRRDPMTARNLALCKKMLDDTFVINDLKKDKDMPHLLQTNSQNFFLICPELISKAATSFVSGDGTPKIDKEKDRTMSFIDARSRVGLIGDALELAFAWW